MLKSKLKSIPLSSVFVALGGIVAGLLIGFLLSIPIDKLPYDWSWAVSVGAYLIFTVGMVVLFLLNEERIVEGFGKLWPGKVESGEHPGEELIVTSEGEDGDVNWSNAFVLDTSAIIDGRIADIIQTGFMQGELVVPSYILQELQQIADSSARVKRNRGRRGLEILRELKKEDFLPFHLLQLELSSSQEVDAALIDLADEKGAKVVTTDFNLNRVGKVRGVRVLNINQLANMVKTVLVPGEELEVEVIQEGKEEDQGVAYLPDGTMIVVEEGREYVGSKIKVVVERLFQTEAGRMIFVRPHRE